MSRGCLLVLGLCLTGCGPSGSARLAVVETDSAGVRIVTNQSLDVPRWTLDETPFLELGVVDGGGPEQFFRVSAARRLRSGDFAILDGSRELRVFAPDGTFLATYGGEGDGPGEYRGPGRMFRLGGDTLAIWDTRLRRLTRLDGEGRVLETISPAGVGMRPQILTVLPDGSTLLEDEIRIGFTPTEYTQQFSNFLLFGPDGALRDSLPVQPRVEVALWGDGPMAGPRMFDEGTQFAGDWGGYWIGTTRSEEVRRYDLDGTLTMLVRWPEGDRIVRDDAADLALEERLRTLSPGTDPEALTELHRKRDVAERYPTHALLEVDALDHLWMQDVERPGSEGPSIWKVFDPTGVLLATVAVPRGHRVFDIGADYVLARGSDDFGVEYIRVFRLTRG